MKKTLAWITITGLFVCAFPTSAFAEPAASDGVIEEMKEEAEEPETGRDEDEEGGKSERPDDNIVTTKHTVSIKGEDISYTAEAGTMVLESGGKTCEMFYTAYTRDDIEDKTDRPVTFAFNGGPGASSYCIQFGCLGPRTAELDETGCAVSLPTKIIDNENSVLDMTDLVFIDPVGTGYSHASNEEDEDYFLGYDKDIQSVGDFIRQYTNRKKRWGSKKYIAGESYGTVRAVGVCDYLVNRYAVYINGLMLISTVNDYSALMAGGGNDTPYTVYIPTYAADAWYHKKLSEEYLDMELEDYLEEVREFVETEYVPALFIGRRLPKAKKDDLAEKMSGYIGLPKDLILENNLRIDLDVFSSNLLKDEGLMVGRYDGRITGPNTGGSLDDGSGDPSGFSTDIAYTNSYLEYLTSELGYDTDTPFIPLSLEVNTKWTFPEGEYLNQQDIIAGCLGKNSFLKIWVLCGYYDGATPFYSAEWAYNHAFIPENREDNLSFTYYPSGHMIYMNHEAFDKFRKDAEKWYDR
ncbi:MAG: hypothetical protein K6F86_04345 [Lachnospiraceae bacterium]|nr:hypothetical protein [Lachnospiraceae bacterium]